MLEIYKGAVTPDLSLELFAQYQSSRLRNKSGQNLEGLGLQADGSATLTQFTSTQIKLECAEPHRIEVIAPDVQVKPPIYQGREEKWMELYNVQARSQVDLLCISFLSRHLAAHSELIHSSSFLH
jgi:hypothetical protein